MSAADGTDGAGGAGKPTGTVGAIVPRWEWRVVGEAFEPAEEMLAARPPERVEESDELYLLGLGRDASVKVRGGLMDVKLLERVDDDGLEQWKPTMKAAFPLGAPDVAGVMAALGHDQRALPRATYTLDELVAELVEPSPDLLAVEVHKVRRHYTVGGCMAELSDLRTDRGARKTIAVESEDPARVVAAVRDLGLAAAENVSIPRGLKALYGFGSERYAVIDVGTNSVKFHIGERSATGGWRTVVDRAEVTRLGQGLDAKGELTEQAMERTSLAIAAMVGEAHREGVAAIAVVGTAGVRLAANRDAFIEAVRDRAGVELEVLPAEEEARLAYIAVESALDIGEGSVVVFDTGGGSSQFTFGQGGCVDEQFSVNLGAARVTERFGLDRAVSEATLASASEAIAADLVRLDDRPVPDVVVGMGGAVTNLAAVHHALATYDPAVIQGTVLEDAEIDRQIELYRTRGADERRTIVGLQPKRAEVILAGACIVRTVLAKLGQTSLTVSDRGLRHGLLVERFAR